VFTNLYSNIVSAQIRATSFMWIQCTRCGPDLGLHHVAVWVTNKTHKNIQHNTM